MRERLAPSRKYFAGWTLAELEGAAADVAAWRAGLTDTSRYRLTLALRQTLAAAVRWGYLTRNPAVDAGQNPEPRAEELHPFTRAELDALVVELGPVSGPLVIFAAETGLRTNEWTAVERRDIVRGEKPAVVVQRRFSDGVETPYPKTQRRRVPLTPRAIEAVDSLPPRLDTPLLFPASEGGHIGLDNWRTRVWYPGWRRRGWSSARAVPSAPHVRHRGARGRGVDLPVVAVDGRVGEDDRQALRAFGARRRGSSAGVARGPLRAIERGDGMTAIARWTLHAHHAFDHDAGRKRDQCTL
jgi:integrase